MQKALTDTFLRSLSAPDHGRLEIADVRCAGLAFRVTSKGARSWCFRFIEPHTRRDARLTLGSYPDIGLSKARELTDSYRQAVARGENPIAVKRKARATAESATFGHLAERYLLEYARRRKRSYSTDERNLKLHVLPRWRSRSYASIGRADVVELLEAIVAAGKLTLVNRVQALISKIFNFAIDSGLMTASPCFRLQRRGVERARRRVLGDAEIRLFWIKVVEAPLPYRLGLALRLALLTGARVSEVAGLSRDELQDIQDADRAAWVIPGERTKNGRSHIIPLAQMAREIVLNLLGRIDKGDRFLFPNRLRPDAPIDRTTLLGVMVRFGHGNIGDDEAARSWKAEPPSPHDLRRTFNSRMAALVVPKEIRDRLLNHAPDKRDTEGRHYNVHDYIAEKRRALCQWDSALSAILSDRPATVVPIGTARKRAQS